MNDQKVFIFANGSLQDGQVVKSLIRPTDVLIAADGGGAHIKQLGLTPTFVVGDLDSISSDLLEEFKKNGCRVLKYTAEKDETDLELAINLALEQGGQSLIIVAALGGRLDQTLGNIGLLTLPALANVDVRLEDGRETVWLVRGQTTITGRAGDVVSLIPWGGSVKDVKTDGLKYPLDYETLYPEKTRGISNVLLDSRATVSIASGVLLCIHTRKK